MPEKKNYGAVSLIFCFLILLGGLAIPNFHIVLDSLPLLSAEEDKNGNSGFVQYVSKVQKDYRENLEQKNDFVSLNGLYARMSGARTSNQVVRTNNGMLTHQTINKLDTKPFAEKTAELSDFLSGLEIPFLYVQAPYKLSLDETMLPIGVEDYANDNADELLNYLQEYGVDTLDLRPYITKTAEQSKQYFYNTDHHWTPIGAFRGFQLIVECLQEIFPDEPICGTATEWDSWEIHRVPDHFLGSRGKRVGPYFGGVDDLIYLTPRFQTEMSCLIPDKSLYYQGNFEDAVIRRQYIDNPIDYYGTTLYYVYIGGEYPVVQHRNGRAPSEKRLLLIKDSFTLPVQSFLSTVFQEIDVVDLRHFTENSLAEYARDFEPDFVLYMINPNVFGEKKFEEFGIDKKFSVPLSEMTYEEVYYNPELVLEADEKDQYRYAVLLEKLESGGSYTLEFDSIEFLKGDAGVVKVQVHVFKNKKTLASCMLDVAYCQETGKYTCNIRVPDSKEKMDLLLYSGIPGNTAGNTVRFSGVTLYKRGVG